MPTDRAHLRIVFLGGIFTPQQADFIAANSRGVVQNAADALQKGMVRGLFENDVLSLTVVNLPFVGSYPHGFAVPNFPSTLEVIHERVRVLGQRFSLVRPIKSFDRMFGALRGLKEAMPSSNHVVLVYSAHLPFVTAAILHRTLSRRVKVYLILPDFPEFMGEGGWKYKLVKNVEVRIFYALAKLIDGFVLLTSAMAERLKLQAGQFTVVEGIASPIGTSTEAPKAGKRVFLYSGTLARRYGITELVSSFGEVAAPDIELWICGDGDARDLVIEAAKADTRIKYLGQVSRDHALNLQTQATVLVNPRRPSGEFTKYSFPSKTMEYMASGRPVLMHRLPGMPVEYLPHFFDPGEAPNGLTMALEKLAKMDGAELDKFGASARSFVLAEKNARAQCRKIISLVCSAE